MARSRRQRNNHLVTFGNDAVRNDATKYNPVALNPSGSMTAETVEKLDQLVSNKPVDNTLETLPGQIGANSYYGPILQNYLRSLPRPSDDVERDFGIDIYEKMMNDPAVASSIQALKVQAMSSGVRFVGRMQKPSAWVTDPQATTDYARSEEILAFVKDSMGCLQDRISAIISDMLDCMAFGHSLAELVYNAPKNGKVTLKTIRVKSRYRFAYVCDRFLEFLGVVPTEKAAGIVPVEWVLPRSKFWHLTIFTHQSDPRGRSLLRPAYHAWYSKQHNWENYYKYLLQFATPSLIALIDENARDVNEVDALGNAVRNANGTLKMISPEELITTRLLQFANSSAIALRNVKSFEVLQAQGAGEPYLKSIELYNTEMIQAIIMAPRALMEAQHGSKADSDTSKDLLDTFTNYIQREVEISFYRDVLTPYVAMNYGQADADAFTPLLMLSANNDRDTVEYGNMIANLANAQYVHPSQYTGIDAQIGLPERDQEAITAEDMLRAAQATEANQHFQSLVDPAPVKTGELPSGVGSTDDSGGGE